MKYKYYINPVDEGALEVVFLQNGQISHLSYNTWYTLKNEPSNIVDIVVAAYSFVVCVIDKDGNFWSARVQVSQENPKWQSDNEITNVVSLESDKDGLVYAVKDNGEVYYWDVLHPKPELRWNLIWSNIPDGEPDYWMYVVKEGDSLWKIVKTEYRTRTIRETSIIVEQIKQLNSELGIQNWSLIHPGLELKMLPK